MSNRPLIFAHRGAKMVAPENTLPAFEMALAMGVDGVELDVHCSKDGQLVVIHDFELGQTSAGQGKISDYTAAELAQIDAGSHFSPDFAGVGIPTLAQVFDLFGNRCQVNVEIKTMDPTGGDQVEPLIEMIQQRDLYEQVIVSSFNPITLIKTRWQDPKIPLGLLYYEPLPAYLRHAWFTPIIQPEAIHPHASLVDEETMEWARARGCQVNTWTVNDLGEARRLQALGVDILMSDIPDQLIAELHSL